ncbi:hypothetical protein GCM10009639_33950 [Kitasatospora putterlickiae]|uniref:Uncharacterized protein n=1 Tax=Kitasatospora putterlickiae TaxID=221725 RepID=A0ABP4IRD5_9ACTN
MEKIFPTEKLSATLMYPFTGLAAGTPVLVRKLMAPWRERRAETAGLKAKQDQIAALAAEAAEATFARKLAGEPDAAKRAAMLQAWEAAQVTARQIELERAKADRKAKRGKLGDAAGAAALMLIVGGPLIWSLVGPWVRPGIGLVIGGWWIAALIHAPTPVKASKPDTEEDVDEDFDDLAPGAATEADQEQPEPSSSALSSDQLVATIERMVAIRAQADGGAGKVHLSEVLESLQRHGLYPGLDGRDFGALARAAGLPVERGLRVKGRGVSVGLTAAAMKAHLGHTPRLPPEAVADNTPAAA